MLGNAHRNLLGSKQIHVSRIDPYVGEFVRGAYPLRSGEASRPHLLAETLARTMGGLGVRTPRSGFL
jgi:hypothetical protein